MSGCSRHQTGGALGEQDQSKCPCSGMSPQAVSFNNPGLLCVELRCPTKTAGLGVNAHLLKRKAIKSVIKSVPQSFVMWSWSYKRPFSVYCFTKTLLALDMILCANLLFLSSEDQVPKVSRLTWILIWAHTNTLHSSIRSSTLSNWSFTQMPARSSWTQVPLSRCVKKAPNTLL